MTIGRSATEVVTVPPPPVGVAASTGSRCARDELLSLVRSRRS